MRIIWLESAKQSPGVWCPSCRQIDGSASDANALPAFSPLQQTRALNYSRDAATLAPFAAKAGHDEEALVSVCPPPLGASSKVITKKSEMQQDLFNFLEEKKARDNKTGMPWRRRRSSRRRQISGLLRHFIYKNKYEIEHIFTKTYVASKNDQFINK